MLAATAHGKGIELYCHVAGNAPSVILGDPGRLRQIIINLAGNAIKFTSCGEVVVNVRPEIENDIEQLHFSVTDTGIGISRDKQHCIFEAFQQSDSSTTRRFGGTGLGLAICSHLVTQMNGRIWVESEEGQGSTFHFVVPIRRPAPRPPAKRAPEVLRGRRALIVSSQPTGQRIYGDLLETLGLVPTFASCHKEAALAFDGPDAPGAPFDLVLFDIPSHDRTSCHHRRIDDLLDSLDTTDCAVVALLPVDRIAEPDRGTSARPVSYLAKPPTTDELAEAMVDVLDHHGVDHDVSSVGTPPIAERPLRVLLADDGPVNQEVAVGMLQLQGHQVTVVDNGSDAVDAMERASFDVVLMDLEMPVLDGLEATRRIRQRESSLGQRTPIIAMTAHAVTGHRKRCLEAGMDGFIAKPIEPDQLFTAMEQCCVPL